MDDGTANRPLRTDAARNRTRLLETAAAALATDPDAGVDDIARRAGVGVGTLYRNFPTRDALVWAVYGREVDTLVIAADHLLAELPPDQALGVWLQRFVGYVTSKRGLVVALRAALDVDEPRFDAARAIVHGAANRLLDAGVAAGTIRGGLTGTDLLRAVGALCLDTDSPGGVERSRALVTIFFDGLRATSSEPLR